MIIRLGIPASFTRFCAAARSLRAPMLVSANALRRPKGFCLPKSLVDIAPEIALDSAGFVAMVRYGGYPWSPDDYVELAGSCSWAWWASMDFCCEPQIAGNPEEIRCRQNETVRLYSYLRGRARERGVRDPLPVLQGWTGDDYLRCADKLGDLPVLIGIGSVCRRELGGVDGLLNVISRLDKLPSHVGFHLFGVKGSAIGALAGHPRIVSIDSMAWDYGARRGKSPGQSCTIDYRISHMRRWYCTQTDSLGLFGRVS